MKAGDERALKLYKSSPKRAVACLTDFSIFLSEKTVAEWKDLEAFLLVKYFDGVIHPEKDGDFIRSRYGRPRTDRNTGLEQTVAGKDRQGRSRTLQGADGGLRWFPALGAYIL